MANGIGNRQLSEQELRAVTVAQINKQIIETNDFELCKRYYASFYDTFYECKSTLDTKLFLMCFNEKNLDIKKYQSVFSLIQKTGYLYNLFATINESLNSTGQIQNDSLSSNQKYDLVHKSIVSYIDNTSSVRELLYMRNVVTSVYSEFDNAFCERAYHLCVNEKGDINDYDSEYFIQQLGKKNKFSQKILWKFVYNVFSYLVVSGILLTVSILVLAKSDVGILMFFAIPTALAAGSSLLQYLIYFVLSIANFFKKKHFTLHATILGYVKKSGGGGRWEVIRDKNKDK